MDLDRFIKEVYVRVKNNFLFNKPRFILRMFEYYKNYFLKKNPLSCVEIAIDFRCNLRCAHCSTTKLVKPPGFSRFSIADYKRLSQEFIGLNVTRLVIGGGEPLFCPNLEEIITALQPRKFFIYLLTNGTLADKKKITRLKKIGVDQLSISFDSLIPQEHDSFRGVPGTFDKAFSALNLALKNGMAVDINTTVTHQNIRSLGMLKLINFAIAKKLSLHMILTAPVGRWSSHWESLVTDDDVEFIAQLHKKSPYIKGDVHFASFFKYHCPAVRDFLYITPYGDVLPCAFLHFSLGNVLKESLAEIRKKGLKLKVFSEYPSRCLAVQDRDFLRWFWSIASDKERLPVDVREVFPSGKILFR